MSEEQLQLLKQAQDSLKAAKILLDNGYLKDAASRAYYSSFYVAEAFLEGEGKSYSSHSAVISVFGRDFANAGKVPVEFHKMLIDAERLRHRADYGRRSIVSSEEAQRQILRAERFLELGDRLILQPASRNLAAVYSARRVLEALNIDSYETDEYVLTRQGETVAIIAKDERGEIARLVDDSVRGNVSVADVLKLNQLEQTVKS